MRLVGGLGVRFLAAVKSLVLAGMVLAPGPVVVGGMLKGKEVGIAALQVRCAISFRKHP